MRIARISFNSCIPSHKPCYRMIGLIIVTPFKLNSNRKREKVERISALLPSGKKKKQEDAHLEYN